MRLAKLGWSWVSVIALAMCGACWNDDGERGYDRCVDACKLTNECAGLTANCSYCESSRKSAEDAGCETEWADYMDCYAALLESAGCTATTDVSTQCASETSAHNECFADYCADNPSECEVAS